MENIELKTMRSWSVCVVLLTAGVGLLSGAPQGDGQPDAGGAPPAAAAAALPAPPSAPAPQPIDEKPMPYEYNYSVEDATNSVYFGADEKGSEAGRVEGSYYVWLADGRLMKIAYYVDGESGYVPTITFEKSANPLGSAAPPAGPAAAPKS